MRRLLVVSHPAVLAVNQLPYAALRDFGWDPFIVTPASWRHEYARASFAPEVLPELEGRVLGRRVLLPGRVQRHVYLTRPRGILAQLKPEVAFLEAETTSAAAAQWSQALERSGVPFGVQAAENLERDWPLPARAFRHRTLSRAAFVAARSPTAATLVRALRPEVPAPVIPHHVPAWTPGRVRGRSEFVVGFAGRLVEAKGPDLLIDALTGVDGAVLRMVGDGPLRTELESRATASGVALEIDTTVKHENMGAAYAGFDVLVLPSLTTPTWVEQFGRVLVEALWCGVPVVGSDSGEIPWVIRSTGGGIVFPEGDVVALRQTLVWLRDSPQSRAELGASGKSQVQRLFSVEAVAQRLNSALRAACGAG